MLKVFDRRTPTPVRLKIVRKEFGPGYTIGDMFVNDTFFCYTLEDTDRALERKGVQAKIYASTAIGCGLYKVVLSQSQRFNKVLPEVLDVPGFKGIRIHSGNTSEDTEGCILVGTDKSMGMIHNSRSAMAQLMEILQRASAISLEITK